MVDSNKLTKVSGLTISVEALSASAQSTYTRLLENSLPGIYKNSSRIAPAERQFAFDTSCYCVEEGLLSIGPELQHAKYFKHDGFKVLQEALEPDLPDNYHTSVSFSGMSLESDSADLAIADTNPLEHPKKKSGIWNKFMRRLSTETASKSTLPEINPKQVSTAPCKSPTRVCVTNLPPGANNDKRNFSVVSIDVEKSFMFLISMAPSRGEIQHWVWLLRSYMDKCNLENVQLMLGYLARIGKYIAAEEEWLRLLVLELTPVFNLMRVNDLSAANQAILRAVADRAMQVSEEAILNFRSHRSSRLENASLLTMAMRLQVLVAKCDPNADSADMEGLFKELLTAAARRRFNALHSKYTVNSGIVTDNIPGNDTSNLIKALSIVCEHLLQDILDDECYQKCFPPDCNIVLALLSCRTYFSQLSLELSHILKQQLVMDQTFFNLFRNVRLLEKTAGKIHPDFSHALSTFEGKLIFFQHIESWSRTVRTKLMQWSIRLIKEESWEQVTTDPLTGARCSPSMVELFRSLCAVAEENNLIVSAHPSYASLLERTFSKVVLVHLSGLEKICQKELSVKSPQKISNTFRSLGSRSSKSSNLDLKNHLPSQTLCILLNDMREVRSKQADLRNLLRSHLPVNWWGKEIDSTVSNSANMQLGDRFKLCQVEIERRYASVLHHTVKRMMEIILPILNNLLEALPSTDDQFFQDGLQSLVNQLNSVTTYLHPLLDSRVHRRITREMWNSLGGALHEHLLDCQEGKGSTIQSLGNIGPRIHAVDNVLKVKKLGRMLALFMREDEGLSIESL